MYESPQAQQALKDVRRKIALALHSLGDEINPASQNQEPRFNRPEDADGFMQSRGVAADGVDADEESKRKQREEMMYWNAVHLEKKEKEKKMAGEGRTFDDFLQKDATAEKGTYVYNTGAEANHEVEGLRNRTLRGLNRGSVYANPFSDEHHIDMMDSQHADSLISPDASEKIDAASDDIYTASPRPRTVEPATANLSEQLVDVSEPIPDPTVSTPTMHDDVDDTNYTNMAADEHDSAYASIHAWADQANNSFYSPLPATPEHEQAIPMPSSPRFSDPPESIPGDITPTDTLSIADSGENVWAPRSGCTSEADVMSVDGEGTSTPGSWTEVGSQVSEDDRHPLHA